MLGVCGIPPLSSFYYQALASILMCYCGFFFFSSKFIENFGTNLKVRPKVHLEHNKSATSTVTQGSDFIEAEMKVDADLLEEDAAEISPGKFVSFRYTGEHNVGGPPMNPRVSCQYSFMFLFFLSLPTPHNLKCLQSHTHKPQKKATFTHFFYFSREATVVSQKRSEQ